MNRIITFAIVVLAALTLGNTGCDPDEVAVGEELVTIDEAYNSGFDLSDHNAIHRLDLVVQLQARLLEAQEIQLADLEARLALVENDVSVSAPLISRLITFEYEYVDPAALLAQHENSIDALNLNVGWINSCLNPAMWNSGCWDLYGIAFPNQP